MHFIYSYYHDHYDYMWCFFWKSWSFLLFFFFLYFWLLLLEFLLLHKLRNEIKGAFFPTLLKDYKNHRKNIFEITCRFYKRGLFCSSICVGFNGSTRRFRSCSVIVMNLFLNKLYRWLSPLLVASRHNCRKNYNNNRLKRTIIK